LPRSDRLPCEPLLPLEPLPLLLDPLLASPPDAE